MSSFAPRILLTGQVWGFFFFNPGFSPRQNYFLVFPFRCRKLMRDLPSLAPRTEGGLRTHDYSPQDQKWIFREKSETLRSEALCFTQLQQFREFPEGLQLGLCQLAENCSLGNIKVVVWVMPGEPGPTAPFFLFFPICCEFRPNSVGEAITDKWKSLILRGLGGQQDMSITRWCETKRKAGFWSFNVF